MEDPKTKKEKIYEIVLQEISDATAVGDIEVTLDTPMDQVEIDSLDAIDMIMAMEEIHSIKIDNTGLDFNNITTVRDLADFISGNATFLKK
jgi:acyl carrier protein